MEDSLFPIFASLAKAIQFLIKLQQYPFWMSKGDSKVNCSKEFEPDVLNTFRAVRVLKIKNKILQILKTHLSVNIIPIEPKSSHLRRFAISFKVVLWRKSHLSFLSHFET